MPLSETRCEQCGQAALSFAYVPERSTRGLKVFVCGHCGLVQSLPRIDRTGLREAMAVSSGADWGNVRYGKGFRTGAAMAALTAHADLARPLCVLDVGSNRGRFATALLEAAPQVRLTAVEPDERFAQSCAGLPRTKLVHARIEDVWLDDASFDIVHSCHTVEHLAHPLAVLKDHARVLKPGGLLVIDAPNIALTASDDVVEEWFIDKHLYHFSHATLSRMLHAAGFAIVAHPDPDDAANLLFVARKAGAVPGGAADPVEAALAMARIARYRKTRAANLAALAQAARAIEALYPRRVALWGAGRLFDSLVLAGFDPRGLALLIDAHLAPLTDTRHGVRLAMPDALTHTPVDTVIVMSRAFAQEIAREAIHRAPGAEILLYADLLARARQAEAA